MNYILFDDNRVQLLPLTFSRPVSKIRIGILCIDEKWIKYLSSKVSYLTEDYLSEKYHLELAQDNIWINGSVLPNKNLCDAILSLNINESLKKDGTILAYRSSSKEVPSHTHEYQKEVIIIRKTWQIFEFNDQCIRDDFDLLTKNKISKQLSSSNSAINPENIFIEEGAYVEHSILNASMGPIYIAKDAEIMEGCMVRGPFAMCQHSVLKMGAKVYGASTLGPYCKVGGEVNNSVFFGYSSKAHDGFLGNSVIGEWCNLGADTNNSNLKNNYADVKLWSYAINRFENTGLQFCGLIMADHSKCSINTMFNTGTVIGVSANIFGSGFPRNFIPSFSWGGSAGYTTYQLQKVFEVTQKVMQRRAYDFNQTEKNILSSIFELTKSYRKD